MEKYNRYQQQSFLFDAPRGGGFLSFISGPFVNPKEFLGIVNQHGKLKVHGVVDTHAEKTEQQILVVGTGQYIDQEILSSLIKIGTMTFCDGQYGYHFYLVVQNEEVEEDYSPDAPFYKEIYVDIKNDADSSDIQELTHTLQLFAQKNAEFTALERGPVKFGNRYAGIILKLRDKDAGFEKTSNFRDLIVYLTISDVAAITVQNV